jgi:hypothetical protein
MPSLLDGLGEEPGEPVESLAVTPTRQLSAKEQRQEALQAVEEEILVESLSIVENALSFQDIEPGTQTPPPDWVERLGVEGAQKRLRMANAAWMSNKDAPMGLQLARATAVGIIKARSSEKQGNRTLNVVQINMPAPAPPRQTAPEDRIIIEENK